MRVVVCTIVHHPADARIYHREIRALLDAGTRSRTSLRTVCSILSPNEPCSRSSPRPFRGPWARRRPGPIRAARAALAQQAAAADLLLVHDPELLLVLPPKHKRPPTVWDVHEDTVAALTTKAWLPARAAAVAAVAVPSAERLAERRLHLILAEHGYDTVRPPAPGRAQHHVRTGSGGTAVPARAASCTSAGSPRTAARRR